MSENLAVFLFLCGFVTVLVSAFGSILFDFNRWWMASVFLGILMGITGIYGLKHLPKKAGSGATVQQTIQLDSSPEQTGVVKDVMGLPNGMVLLSVVSESSDIFVLAQAVRGGPNEMKRGWSAGDKVHFRSLSAKSPNTRTTEIGVVGY